MCAGVGKLQATHDQCRHSRPFFINGQECQVNKRYRSCRKPSPRSLALLKFEPSAPNGAVRMGLIKHVDEAGGGGNIRQGRFPCQAAD